MERFKTLIDTFGEVAPHYKNLLVYIVHIEGNKKTYPGVSIEACKSLLEALSKLITTDIKGYSENHYKNNDARKTVKEANSALSDVIDSYDNQLIEVFATFTHKLSEIRNQTGDISHGRLYPKEWSADPNLATLAIEMTEVICIHMLKGVMQGGFIKNEIRYEENEAFNQFLDDANPQIKLMYRDVLFSKALFDLDFYQYKEQLDEFLEMDNGNPI